MGRPWEQTKEPRERFLPKSLVNWLGPNVPK